MARARLLVGVAAAMIAASCGSPTVEPPSGAPAPTSATPTAAAAATAAAGPADSPAASDDGAIDLATAVAPQPFGDLTDDVRRIIAGSDALYVTTNGAGDLPATLARVGAPGTPDAGAVTAVRDLVPGDDVRPALVTIVDGRVLLRDGLADDWEVLDPTALTSIGRFEIAPGPQSAVGATDGASLVTAHWRTSDELNQGIRSAQMVAVTDIDVVDDVVEQRTQRWPLPNCGGRDVARIGARRFATVRCSWIIVELAGDGSLAGYLPMHRGEGYLEAHDGNLYLVYKDLGVVSVVDPDTGESASVQVPLQPGQRLRDAVIVGDDTDANTAGGGAIWVLREDETGATAPLLLRFDPDLSSVTRISMRGFRPVVAFVGDTAWFAPLEGGLASASIRELPVDPAPTEAVEPPALLETQEGRSEDIVAIEQRFAPIFDPDADPADLVDVLEHAAELEPARLEVASFVTDDLLGSQLRVLTFIDRGDTAVATYTFTIDGQTPLLATQVATLVRTGSGWQMPADAFCDAIAVLFIDCPSIAGR